MPKTLRPHQREAVDAVLRALELPVRSAVPERGLRTQVVMATGSGKTLVAVRSAEELGAGRVLVLVPSLDLLTQTQAEWHEGGRKGLMIGVSSLRGDQAVFPNTTAVEELVDWVRPFEKVTVFATYASLGLGTLERAHEDGLPGWDLVVVDESHRTSGRIGKPWAVVHDNTRIPALRRLYMTATPRLWQLDDETEPGVAGELVASMEDDPDGPFGSRCYTLTLSEAINWGICAPYQVVCVDITDTQLQATRVLGVEGRSDEVRGARLAALQTALVKASAEESFGRTLVFHHLVREAEAFAAGLPDVAAQLHADDPELYPSAVWADWLCGDHPPAHRRRVLDEFAGGTNTARRFLGSAKVLGEGVDIQNCDSVYFADVRGSMPDLVQAVGRALRIQPGEGKVASLVVPILLGPGETADNMLTSRAYGGLAKLLEALRAHDTRIVEALAVPQAPSRSKGVQSRTGGQDAEHAEGEDGILVSVPARALLKFSTPRDAAALAAFISLRVLNPEKEHWRRGVEAAVIYTRLHGGLKIPFTYRVPDSREQEADHKGKGQRGAGEGARQVWPASLAGFPLGQWIADARHRHARGRLDTERARQLEQLGMVWSHRDVAWEEGLTAARGWAKENGHLLAPLDAVHRGHKAGIWLKNARADARAGTLAPERREQLEDIDPSWCPAWPVQWQRAFRLVRQHLQVRGVLPTAPGEVVHQGEDLGRWVRAQRLGWDKLTGGQQWMCEQILGIEPAAEDEKPKPRRTQGDKWALNYAAARQFYEREGHLRVPRGHVERIATGDDGQGQEEQDLKLGSWISNQRSRAATLSPERVEQLSAIGMRWP
ncbi:DEAD/DEAH box helicase [Streptomyces wuyuanensis]|uniref:Helicase conserved C-terminal domain-containing protein n=1 Tax=Streptomyces wuyuanensis TaxID=1196353 RepID=A0A1H0DYB6_9ACTN|nr:DEAD/DEAH box helicase [Streptomyces wuyuanensis]SDN75026.1 Helicase conserved C-terminal domain-containing protein [Streptomyces wuyuanensis]